MARLEALCKGLNRLIYRLFTRQARVPESCAQARIGLPESDPEATPWRFEARPGFYYLLCMFNGFAFARPLCGAIKEMPEGVGLG